MKYKVKVLMDLDIWGSEEELFIIMDEDDLEHLKNEMAGFNIGIWEYETTNKKIIADDMIRSIIKVEELKNGVCSFCDKEKPIEDLREVVNGGELVCRYLDECEGFK